MTAFEVYYEKYNNIMKWLPEVLEKEFRTIDKYGHLLEGLLQGKTYLYDANQHDWKDGPKSCSKFFIIIKKGRSTNHFFIKSVYPC